MDQGPGREPDAVRIETIDLTDDDQQLRLGCEIAALANSGGGRILVGIEVEWADQWSQQELERLSDRLLAPDRLALAMTLAPVEMPPGRAVVEIDVPRCDNPPLVVIDGPRSDHAVLVRRNGRVEAARRADYLRWRHELRQRLLQQFQMLVEAPESSRLRVVGDDEVRDEPTFMLSRAVDLFQQRRDKLLDGDDLLYLFLHRHTIDFGAADGLVADLLVHSALRRRATLFFWLALTRVESERVRGLLHEALGGADRDKSDMSTVVPLVAALYLDDVSYAGVIDLMNRSRYAHMATAAKEHPTRHGALAAVEERRRSELDGKLLARLGDDELLLLADELAANGGGAKASRRMPNLGLEYLARRLA